MAELRLLVVCFNFPPNPGIGGRRWAKFAKYLSRKGHDVHIISADRKIEEVSNWNQDTDSPRIHNHRIPSRFPEYLMRPVKNTKERIQFHLHYRWNKLFVKGSKFDSAKFWRKDLLAKAEELIQKNSITHIVVSSPPFYQFVYITEVKKKFPHVKLIFEYRDPWTILDYSYGRADLTPSERDYEKKLEIESAQASDLITGPTLFVTDYLTDYGVKTPRTALPHAWDSDDLENVRNIPERPADNKIILTYGGTFYLETEPSFNALADAMAKMKEGNPKLYQRIEFRFYMNRLHLHELFISKGIENVKFLPPVPLEEYWKIKKQSDICLLMFAGYSKNNMSSKFFELLSLKKPVLILGDRGATADFLETNKLGTSIAPSEMATHLPVVINELMNPDNFNKNYDVDQHSFDRVTDQLLEMLNSMP